LFRGVLLCPESGFPQIVAGGLGVGMPVEQERRGPVPAFVNVSVCRRILLRNDLLQQGCKSGTGVYERLLQRGQFRCVPIRARNLQWVAITIVVSAEDKPGCPMVVE
jgi:hypothetical protein